uniref:NADH-ubiquinone oxidoreductase chain 5 n=1 Tax=Galdieria sulphuraria TaxID=130081 RepID=A0A075W2R7_GALSU|nr:NADH dehydrogenase subunit 5 [Galdieria sulphuraria]AIG92648.1 NADH dehydrogenase subunit 5 [Galdieria sulphuraria]
MMPIIGGVIGLVMGRKIGGEGSSRLNIRSMRWSVVMISMELYEVVINGVKKEVRMWEWMREGVERVECGVIEEREVVEMMWMVVVVGSIVEEYSRWYMKEEGERVRFMSIVSIFIGSMLILVGSENMLQMYIGWEGIGVCSYILISYWSSRSETSKAGMKAMVINRIGDMGIMLGIGKGYVSYGSVSYGVMKSVVIEEDRIMGIMIIMGVMTKSSQMGMQTWLSDAMEGPTPVSALIHAATLVTAGVYVVIRMEGIIGGKEIMIGIGGGSIVYIGMLGVYAQDIKKIIAYSTGSQLGYMVLSVGVESSNNSISHVINHGMVKGMLFMSAGGIIHSRKEEQDIRKMGGGVMRVSKMGVIIGSMGIMGIEYSSGYESKEEIIRESSMSRYGEISSELGVCITSYYSIRMIKRVIVSEGKKRREEEEEEGMKRSIMWMSIIGVIIGYMKREWEREEWEEEIGKKEKEMMMIGVVLGIYKEKIKGRRIGRWIGKKWYNEVWQNRWIGRRVEEMCREIVEGIDRKILEECGGKGSREMMEVMERVVRRRGNVSKYGIGMVIGIIMWGWSCG